MKLAELKGLIRSTIADLDKLSDTDAYSRGRKEAYEAVLELLQRVEDEEGGLCAAGEGCLARPAC